MSATATPPATPARPAETPVLTHAEQRDPEDEVRRGAGACIRCLPLRSTSSWIAESPRSSFAVATGIWASPPGHPQRAELGHAPSPVLARFVLALVSERKSGTSLAGSRNGTIWEARPPGGPITSTTAEQVSRSRDSRTSSSPANGNRVPVPPRAMNDSARRGEPLSHPNRRLEFR
jgi:hypothetical protein